MYMQSENFFFHSGHPYIDVLTLPTIFDNRKNCIFRLPHVDHCATNHRLSKKLQKRCSEALKAIST